MFCSVWLSNLSSPGRLGHLTKGRFLLCWVRKAGIPCYGAVKAGCYCSGGAGVDSGHLGLVHISTCLRVCLSILYGWDDSRQSRVGALVWSFSFAISHCMSSIHPRSGAIGVSFGCFGCSGFLGFALLQYTPDAFRRGSEFYLGIATFSVFTLWSSFSNLSEVPFWQPCAGVRVALERLPR